MTDIIDFQKHKEDTEESDAWGYFEYDHSGDIGVKCKLAEIAIEPLNNKEYSLFLNDQDNLISRKQLAEFLWAAAYFVDGDREWLKGKYVCQKKN